MSDLLEVTQQLSDIVRKGPEFWILLSFGFTSIENLEPFIKEKFIRKEGIVTRDQYYFNINKLGQTKKSIFSFPVVLLDS